MAASLGLFSHEMYSAAGSSSCFFPPGGLVADDSGAVMEFPPAAAVAEADCFLPEIMGAGGQSHDYYCSPPAPVFAASGGAAENDMMMSMSYVDDDGRMMMMGSRSAAGNGGGGRASRRIGFRTRTEVDVLDDGFKWRKYGKKAVKSSPNPRNYYRCSAEGCGVKKRVERDRDDPRYVVTTYDGVHNHAASGAGAAARHLAPARPACSTAPWGGAPCDAWGASQLQAAAVAAAQAQAHSSESSY